MKIIYIHEPTNLQCGQAVLAMITGRDVADVARDLDNSRETDLREMKGYLRSCGFCIGDERKTVNTKEELPSLCILSLETPRCWHWSMYHNGVFYDPEHGVMDDFPECKRKFYWEVKENGK